MKEELQLLMKMPWKHRVLMVALTAINALLSYYAFDSWGLMVKGFLFSEILMVASYYDIQTRIIPDWLHVLLLLVGLIEFDPVKSVLGLLIAPLPFLFMAMIQEGSIGGGDVKIVGAMGFCEGLLVVINVIFLAMLFAFIFSLVYYLRHKNKSYIIFPVVPFLYVGWSVFVISVMCTLN